MDTPCSGAWWDDEIRDASCSAGIITPDLPLQGWTALDCVSASARGSSRPRVGSPENSSSPLDKEDGAASCRFGVGDDLVHSKGIKNWESSDSQQVR